MKRYIPKFLLTSLLFTLNNSFLFGQEPEWKQIFVLQSTQAEVESILGPPRTDINSDLILSFFRVKDGFLSVHYSVGFCEPGVTRGWDVEKGVVERIVFEPKVYPKFKSLKLDRKKYKKSIDGDVGDIFTYRSREDGIEYTVQYGKILAIIHFPSTKYDHLRCGVVNNLEN